MVDKTLVFCTAFVPDRIHSTDTSLDKNYYSWEVRYRLWVESIKRSHVNFDQILIVDDGSSRLPQWDDVCIIQEGASLKCNALFALYHFKNRLGRRNLSDFPGWVRSFFFVSDYAKANNFTKIVHIESDAFLISKKPCDIVNELTSGWTSFWCTRFNRPESGIQVIAGSELEVFADLATRPVDAFATHVIEKTLPFTNIVRDLIGDRYGENIFNWVPKDADWCMQARPTHLGSYQTYFWWMDWIEEMFPDLSSSMPTFAKRLHKESELSHGGIYYLEFLGSLAAISAPKLYFEIGTHTGSSLKAISADAVCVDPNFKVTSDVLGRRRSTYFFQGTSDEFFDQPNAGLQMLKKGVDLAFLDGLHLFEALLQDFINTEKLTKPRSIVILHDCLPLNERMAERLRRNGGADEPERIREFWTGDVWKMLVILKRYRPEIVVTYFDCPPTGLVLCTGLNSKNTTLQENFSQIIEEYANLSLKEIGLTKLWNLYPTFDSKQFKVAGPELVKNLEKAEEPN